MIYWISGYKKANGHSVREHKKTMYLDEPPTQFTTSPTHLQNALGILILEWVIFSKSRFILWKFDSSRGQNWTADIVKMIKHHDILWLTNTATWGMRVSWTDYKDEKLEEHLTLSSTYIHIPNIKSSSFPVLIQFSKNNIKSSSLALS